MIAHSYDRDGIEGEGTSTLARDPSDINQTD